MSYKALMRILLNDDINDTDKIISLDSPKYYSILSHKIKNTYNCEVLYKGMSANCFKHIILSRKIAWQHSIIIIRIINALDTSAEIEQFFSFYDHNEIIRIMHYNLSYSYAWKQKYIANTMCMLCLIHEKHCFNKYIINYLSMYNVNIITYIEKTPVEWFSTILTYHDEASAIINNHENAVEYARSLRSTWLLSIIIIEYNIS